ncbi:hypothetical protein Ancab_026703 [Ancistrocladus abbreviatus]
MAPSRMLLAPSMSPPIDEPPFAAYSDMIIVLVALLCAIVCVVGLMAVARSACHSRFCCSRSPSIAGTNTPLPEGFKKKMIESLVPKLTYKSSSCSHRNDDNSVQKTTVAVAVAIAPDQCAICLSEFVDGDDIRILPLCGHVFHVGCIDRWLRSHASCPYCRQILFIAKCQKFNCISPPTSQPYFLPQLEIKFHGISIRLTESTEKGGAKAPQLLGSGGGKKLAVVVSSRLHAAGRLLA